jgi:hypothetical protein
MRNPLKLFKISEKEKKNILAQHINATKKQYLSESQENNEIYSFKNPSEKSKGFSDMDDTDFYELLTKGDLDLGFDAMGVADLKRIKSEKTPERVVKKPKQISREEMTESQYPVRLMIDDLKEATGITDEMIELIMGGDEQALSDAELMFGYSDDGKVRRGILAKLDRLFGLNTGI